MDLAITIFVTLANIVLGVVVYRRNKKSATNILFLLLTLIIASWTVTNYFSLHSPDAQTTLFWIRVVMLVVSPFGPVIFFFLYAFPREKLEVKKKYIFAVALLVTLTGCVAMSPYMFTDVVIVNGNIQPTPGPGIILFALNFLPFLGAGFVAISRKYRRAKGLEKTQIRLLLWGAIVSFSLITITNFIFVVVFKVSSFVALGPPLTLILVGFISYAIVKQELFGIKVVFNEILVVTIGAVTLLQALLADTLRTRILGLGTFFLFCFLGYLLLKEVRRGIRLTETLGEKVEERTRDLRRAYDELKERKEDLEKFYRLTVGREMKMIELKEKIKELEEKIKE